MRGGPRDFVAADKQLLAFSRDGLDAERSQRIDDRRGEIAVQNGPFVLVYDKSVIDVSVVMVDGSASRKAPDYLDAVPQTVIGVYPASIRWLRPTMTDGRLI